MIKVNVRLSICAFFLALVAAFESPLAGQPDSRFEKFKRSDLFSLKLAVARIRHGFLSNNPSEVLSHVSPTYHENSNRESKGDKTFPSQVVNAVTSKVAQGSSGIRDISFTITSATLQNDTADVALEVTVYFAEDRRQVQAEQCQLRLARLGGSWQVIASDNWLAKMQKLFFPGVVDMSKEFENNRGDAPQGGK